MIGVGRWGRPASKSCPIGIPVAARGAVPVTVPAAARSAVAIAAATRPTVTVTAATRATVTATAATHGRVAGADGGELLLGLAGDLRFVGEAQADAAALLVDLDDANLDLVTLVEHLLDRPDAVARRDVGDVQQAVGALGELDEGA